MGNLLKMVTCAVGFVYLVMHVAYALTSAADSLRNRDAQARHSATFGGNNAMSRKVPAHHQDAVGLEPRASS